MAWLIDKFIGLALTLLASQGVFSCLDENFLGVTLDASWNVERGVRILIKN
jgi:hypothetical protein